MFLGAGAGVSDGGRSTESMAWMTPFEAFTLAATTLLSLTLSPPDDVTLICTASPWTVVAEVSLAACAA